MSQEGSQVPFHFAVTDLEAEKSYVGGNSTRDVGWLVAFCTGGKERSLLYPWVWLIYLPFTTLIFMVNVGKYTWIRHGYW